MPPACSLTNLTAAWMPVTLVSLTTTAPPCWLKYPILIGVLLASAAPDPPMYPAKSVTLSALAGGVVPAAAGVVAAAAGVVAAAAGVVAAAGGVVAAAGGVV